MTQDALHLISICAPDMVSVHTPTGDFTYVSHTCYRLFGWHPHELIGKSDFNFLHPDDMLRVGQNHNSGSSTYRFKCRDGGYRWVEVRTGKDGDGNIVCVTRALGPDDLNDVTKKLIDLQEKASKDPLSGLWRRESIVEIIEHQLKIARTKGQKLSVILLDIDNLKIVNDTKGHSAGDKIIKQAADAIQTVIRATDAAGRYGGDEFVIVLQDCDKPGAIRVAESIQSKIREVNPNLSVSIGTVTSRAHSSPIRLIDKADVLMYEAKKLRNCVVGASTDDLPLIPHTDDT